MEKSDCDNESLINGVQNEKAIWDSNFNASEEDKELAWKRIADSFGITNGWYMCCTILQYTNCWILLSYAVIYSVQFECSILFCFQFQRFALNGIVSVPALQGS